MNKTSLTQGRIMKNITINGKEYPLTGESTLADIFEQLCIKTEKMAVELNEEIIPRNSLKNTKVKTSDKIEIIQFVGGG